jgi:hypothetical protein
MIMVSHKIMPPKFMKNSILFKTLHRSYTILQPTYLGFSRYNPSKSIIKNINVFFNGEHVISECALCYFTYIIGSDVHLLQISQYSD